MVGICKRDIIEIMENLELKRLEKSNKHNTEQLSNDNELAFELKGPNLVITGNQMDVRMQKIIRYLGAGTSAFKSRIHNEYGDIRIYIVKENIGMVSLEFLVATGMGLI